MKEYSPPHLFKLDLRDPFQAALDFQKDSPQCHVDVTPPNGRKVSFFLSYPVRKPIGGEMALVTSHGLCFGGIVTFDGSPDSIEVEVGEVKTVEVKGKDYVIRGW